MAALTARGRGLDCFQPQSRQPVLRQNKLRIFRFRASAKAQSLRLFLLSPQSGHFVGAPIMARHCVSKQIGRHDAACHGCPRCFSRSPEARFRVVARTVRVSQPAVLAALLVIQLFGIVIPPPYFPKEHQKERCGREWPQRSFITFHGALRNILLSAGFPAMFHMITLEQMFINDSLQKILSCCCRFSIESILSLLPRKQGRCICGYTRMLTR